MHRTPEVLTPGIVALIVTTILMLSAGQILFKQAASGLSLARPETWFGWPLLLAVAIYGLATMMWLAVLARVSLSIAFPFYGLTFLVVPVLAWLILKEPLRPQVLLGGVVIMLGVVITTMGERS